MGYKGQEYIDIDKNGIVKSALAVAVMNPADIPIKTELDNKFIVWPYNTVQPYMKDTARTQSVSLTQWIRQGLTFAFGRNGGAVPDDPNAMGKIAENDVNDGTSDSIRKIALATKTSVAGLSSALTSGPGSVRAVVNALTDDDLGLPMIAGATDAAAQFAMNMNSTVIRFDGEETRRQQPGVLDRPTYVQLSNENTPYFLGSYEDNLIDRLFVKEPGVYVFDHETWAGPVTYYVPSCNGFTDIINIKDDYETYCGHEFVGGAAMNIVFYPMNALPAKASLYLLGDIA